MIFNPRRGGSEKEYMITVGNGITTSATKLKPGHVFEVSSNKSEYPKMKFTDPDTRKSVTMQGTMQGIN